MATTAGRVANAVAATAMVVAILLAVLPNPGTAVIVEPSRRVNCGTMFVESAFSGDDGCEGPLLARTGLAVLAWLGAMPLGATGLLLLRRGLRTS